MRHCNRALVALVLLSTPLASQVQVNQGPSPVDATSPANGDTLGYWQQEVRYRIVALLDESTNVLHGTAQLTYVNHSPDTLRELWVHQHLNAFRPGSAWARADEREGRVRFQNLQDPDYAYERFTTTPTIDGQPVVAEYPGAPDSTVVRFALPRPLAPGASIQVELKWDARLSTLPRRQGRQGRSYDFAQWYPKVAVYDRGGWEPHPLMPGGEFYGEFGTYEVTLMVRDDQVIGATGVPVAGDPGWQRVLRSGSVTSKASAYGSFTGSSAPVPRDMRAVTFVARDVHHFAWSTSPDYRYEGGVYIRSSLRPSPRVSPFDTVAIHVLYRPGDEATWGGGKAVKYTQDALAWLEKTYGPYPYPQMTNLHRIEGGGTEFPMMMMNGSASFGLVLHEGGHNYTYGILANNEWQSGWMDEGFTSYQTAWRLGETAQERSRSAPQARPRVPGYRGLGLRPSPLEQSQIERYRLDLLGRTEPIGRRGDLFNEFGVYNSMVYTRAQSMYSALRDAIGDSAFVRFLHTYYDRWALRHVDEVAMRKAAEDASGQDLRWFFDQWVHRVGLIDYSLKGVRTWQEDDDYITRVRVTKRGEYIHPMPVGVRTEDGWTVERLRDPTQYSQDVDVHTRKPPLEVRLDPFETADDWYGPNDPRHIPGPLQILAGKAVFDWPFLEQWRENRLVNAFTPIGWYGTPGGVAIGARVRGNYQGWLNRTELGAAWYVDGASTPPTAFSGVHIRHVTPFDRLQTWAVADDFRLPWKGRPSVGLHGEAWAVDGILKLGLRKSRDLSQFLLAPRPKQSLTLSLDGTYPIEHSLIDPSRWSGLSSTEASLAFQRSMNTATGINEQRVSFAGGFASGHATPSFEHNWFSRLEGWWRASRGSLTSRAPTLGRVYAGLTKQAPLERAILKGASNATQTFANHLYRPLGSPLSRPSWHYQALGGAGCRWCVDPLTPVGTDEPVAAINIEQDLRVLQLGPAARPLAIGADVWSDVLFAGSKYDSSVGVGLVARGWIFDRQARIRVDAPVIRARGGSRGTWRFSFTDLW